MQTDPYPVRRTLALLLACCGAVALLPATFQEPWCTIPVNLWTAVHLLTTHSFRHILPGLTLRRYWLLVVGWEVVEQLVPVVVASAGHFRETWGDVLGDLLVAIPASLWLPRRRSKKMPPQEDKASTAAPAIAPTHHASRHP